MVELDRRAQSLPVYALGYEGARVVERGRYDVGCADQPAEEEPAIVLHGKSIRKGTRRCETHESPMCLTFELADGLDIAHISANGDAAAVDGRVTCGVDAVDAGGL